MLSPLPSLPELHANSSNAPTGNRRIPIAAARSFMYCYCHQDSGGAIRSKPDGFESRWNEVMRDRSPSVLAVAAAMGIVALAPAKGHAEPDSVAICLEYSAASGCPAPDLFKTTVENRLGYDVFAEDAPSRVLVLITSDGQAFAGTMEWRDPQGNWAGDRTFPTNSSDCEDLVRAMAFTLALQVLLTDVPGSPPGTSTKTVKNEPKPPTSPPVRPAGDKPTAKPPKSSTQEAEPPPSRRPRPVPALGAGTLVGFGMSSGLIPFARASGGVEWPRWSLVLAFEASFPTTIQRQDGAGFSHQQVLASLTGCRSLDPWSLCAVVKAGEVSVAGEDIDDPALATGPMLETGLRAGATLRVSRRLELSASGEALVLPILWSVTLDDSTVWTSPRLAGTLGLDLMVRFE